MLLRQSEVEQKYRLSKTTLHRWLKDGKLTEHRTAGGHRRYDRAEIEKLLSLSDGITVTEKDGALYARVSPQKQAENLTRHGVRLFRDCLWLKRQSPPVLHDQRRGLQG
jgi:excisionase family DNA binding protein